MSRCFRCDGVGCAECLDLADYRISQEISGRATRLAAELARTHHEWCDFRESVEAGEPERACDCWLEDAPCCGQPDTCERDCPLDGAA